MHILYSTRQSFKTVLFLSLSLHMDRASAWRETRKKISNYTVLYITSLVCPKPLGNGYKNLGSNGYSVAIIVKSQRLNNFKSVKRYFRHDIKVEENSISQ